MAEWDHKYNPGTICAVPWTQKESSSQLSILLEPMQWSKDSRNIYDPFS